MEPEIIVGILAIFVSGGAMGAAGTILGQWVLRKISAPPPRQMGFVKPREMEVLRAEVADMATRLHSVDTRLDFTEQLLGGALWGVLPRNRSRPPSLAPQQTPMDRAIVRTPMTLPSRATVKTPTR